MDKICNDIAKNLTLFGHITQTHTSMQANMLKSQELKHNATPNYATNPNKTQTEDVFSTYNSIINYIKKLDEEKKTAKENSNKPSSEKGKDQVFANVSSNYSIFKEQKEKETYQKAPMTYDKPFNILGLFKPGEFLNQNKEDVSPRIQQPSLNTKLHLSYLS